MKKIYKTFRKLKSRRVKTEALKGKMEILIMNNVEFRFSVVDVPGNGFCVLNENTSSLAPLAGCLTAIQEYGKLTFKKHNELSI